LIGRADYAAPIALAHAAALALPWLLDRGAGRYGSFTRTLHDVYPLLLMLAFWTELGFLRPFHGPTHDAWVTALDLAVFRVHLNVVWMPRMPWLWFSELMHLSYYAYYIIIIGPPLALLLTGRREAMRYVVLRLMVTYLGCYTLYLMFPVDGPGHTMVHYQGAPNTGFFYHLVHEAGDFGDSMGTAFPSSHVAGALTAAWAGWRWFSRPVAILLALEAAGVVVATVYTQNHYAIDVLAGILWAVLLQLTVVPALERA
jgi:membrane-associated phospholipid phosphatase